MERQSRRVDVWLSAIVVLLAVIAAVAMFVGYYQHPELLWRGDPSDRSTHFNQGLRLAVTLRNLDFASFCHEIVSAKFYPPFHGFVLSAFLLVGGLDVRLGIIPSLIGWTITVSMTWVIARRFFRDQTDSIFAGSTAAIFALASPTFGFLATDVMLECLGSALTALAIYFHMRTDAQPENQLNWRLLAITLTFLFYEKYNYWVLAVTALVLTHLLILQGPSRWTATARLWWRDDGRRLAGAVARDPAVLVCAALVCFILYVYWRGSEEISVFGWKISVYPPNRPMTIAYVILWGRLAVAWFYHRRAIETALGLSGRTMLYWHVVPVTVSLLWPGRLPWFLFAVGPTNSVDPPQNPFSGLLEYWHGFAHGFTVTPWAAVLAALLAMIAFAQRRKFAPQCQAIFVLVFTCATLVVLHPNHQARFLASWIFAVWVCVGAGAGLVFQWATRFTDSPSIRAALAGCAIAALAFTTGINKPLPTVAAAYAHQTAGPSEFDLLPAVLHSLPDFADGQQIGFLPDPGDNRDFLLWNAEMQCRCRLNPDYPGYLNELGRDEAIRRLLAWIRQTNSDVIVGVFARGTEWLINTMKTQDRFQLATIRTIPGHQAEVVVWRK